MELERRAVYFHGFGVKVIYFQGSREQETFGSGLG